MLMAGCASLTAAKFTSQNRQNLPKLFVGMPASAAMEIMGNASVNLTCPKSDKCSEKQLVVANPYFTETLQVSDRKLEVIYYAVDISDDCVVNENTLVPLVFDEKKLIGWGQEFLKGLKKS